MSAVGPRQRPIASSPYGRKGSSPSSPGASGIVPPVDPRRAKKRELDRRCQRMARERTKNRIAYLESLVEDFRSQDGSGRLAKLMQQLNDLSKERDELKKVVRAVESVVKNVAATDEQSLASAIDDLAVKAEVAEVPRTAPTSAPRPNPGRATSTSTAKQASVTQTDSDVDNDSSESDDDSEADPRVVSSRPVMPPTITVTSVPQPKSPSVIPARIGASGPAITPVQRAAAVVSLPKAEPVRSKYLHKCECQSDTPRHSYGSDINMWRYANETVAWKPLLDDHLMELEDRLADDIPIRAVLDGWESVELLFRNLRAAGILKNNDTSQDYEGQDDPDWDDGDTALPPIWRKMRRFDTVIFFHCAPVERIAILRICHLFSRWQAQPTASRTKTLPTWYLQRPSQAALAHSPAMDYFPWPGMRERFVFKEHRYCTNQFWALFCQSLRFVWPQDFDACYTKVETKGKGPASSTDFIGGSLMPHFYRTSPKFTTRVLDIDAWTMGRDFFERFPEYYSDVRTWNHPPKEIGGASNIAIIEEDEEDDSEYETQPGSASPGKRKRAGTGPSGQGQSYREAIVKRNRSRSSASATSSAAQPSTLASTPISGPAATPYRDVRMTGSPMYGVQASDARQSQPQRPAQQRQPQASQRRQVLGSLSTGLGLESDYVSRRSTTFPPVNRRSSNHTTLQPSPLGAAMVPSGNNLLSPQSQVQGTSMSEQGWWSASPTDMSVVSAFAALPFADANTSPYPQQGPLPVVHRQQAPGSVPMMDPGNSEMYAHSPFATQQIDRSYLGAAYDGSLGLGNRAVQGQARSGHNPYFGQARVSGSQQQWQAGEAFDIDRGTAQTDGPPSPGSNTFGYTGFQHE